MPNEERGNLYSESSKKGDMSERWKELKTCSVTWEIFFTSMILSILNREVEIIVSISEAQYGVLGGKDMKAQRSSVHDFYI